MSTTTSLPTPGSEEARLPDHAAGDRGWRGGCRGRLAHRPAVTTASRLEQYITVCEKTNVTTQTVQAGLLDLATPAGRLVAQLGAVAVYESEQKGRRQKAANKQRAAEGKYFGTRRPFGYESDGVTVRDVELGHPGCLDLILIGGSLREVGRRWNAAGLHTHPEASALEREQDRLADLRTARLAGIKTYLGDVVRMSGVSRSARVAGDR